MRLPMCTCYIALIVNNGNVLLIFKKLNVKEIWDIYLRYYLLVVANKSQNSKA